MNRRNGWRGWGLLLLGWLLAGCATLPPARADLLDFLRVGQTTREEVILRLGQPSGTYEQERILTYRIGQAGDEGYYLVSPRAVGPEGAPFHAERFSLVMVFDAQGRLEKHQLVRVR
ncbi:MAG: hypothetical protein RJA22_521 [Verrucomicrobiota bacterium]|jgi:hypothetical protein